MSLDWRFTNGKKTSDDPVLGQFCEVMVFACLFVDLSGVTEKNIDEWLFRTQISRQLSKDFGTASIKQKDGTFKHVPWYPDRATLEKFVGLQTNVSNETRATWLKKIQRIMVRDAETALRYEREEREEKVNGDT